MRRAVACMLIALAMAVPATAQESKGIPRLGDHEFVPVVTIVEPFMTTHVQMGLGVGWTVNSRVPLFSPVDSTLVGTVPSNQFLTGIAFEYQQGVKEWMVVRVDLDVIGRLGTNTSSLLADGLTGALGYQFSWKLRIYEARTVLLSGSVGLGNNNGTFINLSQWAQQIIAGEDADLVRGRHSLSGFGGVHVGWGINRRFGVLGSVIGTYGEPFDGSGNNAWYSDVRAGISYDARQDLDVPLGLALTGGRSENDINVDTDAGTWFWNLRLAVQGREDFTFGIGVGSSYFDAASSDSRQEFFQVTIDMRYFY